MKIDLPLAVAGGALSAVAEVARQAEEAGFDGVSYSELSSDPILHLTVAAGATRRVDLLTNITVAFARTPMVLAVQGRALQDYSGGRLILGLGSQIKPHIERRFSMPWSSPAARMAEFVQAMRAIWHAWETGEPLRFEGEFYTHTLMTPMFTPPTTQPAPRVFLAAVGELMTETAGAVADGVLLHPFSTLDYVEQVTLPAIARGRLASDLADRPFDVVSSAFVVTGRDDAELAASATAARNQIAFYGSTPAYLPVLTQHGWEDLGHELNRLSKGSDPGRWEQMGRLVDDNVLQEFAVIGAPEEVGRKLLHRWGHVITRFEINHVSLPDPALQLQVAAGIRTALSM